MKPMMKCGHAANAVNTKDGTPVCVICTGFTSNAFEIDKNSPDLTNRKARCSYYGSVPSGRNHESLFKCKRGEKCLCEVDSSSDLPFFKIEKTRDHDSFFCGCWGWS